MRSIRIIQFKSKNIMDSRGMSRTAVGVYTVVMLVPFLQFLYKIMSFGLTRNIQRSSCHFPEKTLPMYEYGAPC